MLVDRLANIEEFVFHNRPKVSSMVITWDLFWSMVESGEVSLDEMDKVNLELTLSAIKAIEAGDKQIWYRAADRYASFGASDTEPRWQFEWMWRQAHGDED